MDDCEFDVSPKLNLNTMFTMQNKQKKHLCRLCYYETTDTTEIFSEKGKELDYEGKINKYLYLYVSAEDDFPKTICWMCSQHLETFHKFYEKINEIQKSTLKDDYESTVLRPIYEKTESYLSVEHAQGSTETVNEDDNDENNMVELLYVSDDFDGVSEMVDSQKYDVEEAVINSQGSTDGCIIENVTQLEHLSHIEIVEDNTKRPPQFLNSGEKETTIANNDEALGLDTEEHRNYDTPLTSEELKTNENISNVIPVFLEKVNGNETTGMSSTRSNERITRSGRSVTNNRVELSSVSKTGTESKKARKFGDPCSVKKEKVTPDEEEAKLALQEIKPVKRGRPTRRTQIKEEMASAEIRTAKETPKAKKLKYQDVPKHDIDEGESENEFPARDSDNDDWPAQQTLNQFPKEILKDDGLLLVKGKELMSMICKFYKLDCELCEDKPRYKHLKDLFDHYSTIHKEIGYVSCCQTKIQRYPAIIMHMARHIQPEAFKCDECGYMVTRPRFLASHKQTHLPEAEKPYGCNICDRRFCWKGALQIHMISHQPADERRLYVCHMCGKVYDTPGGLSTHKKLIHSSKQKKDSNVCHVCAKSFATRTGLHEHMSTIHQPRERDQMQCSECGKWLMNYRCLKSHMVLHSDASFKCTICDYTTKKNVLLNRHMLTQHSEEKPHKCHICSKSFKLKRALTVHINQHNNSKTYQCPFCERAFNSSTNYYTHRKSVHPKELQEMKNRELEEKRQKRIEAGIEDTSEIDTSYTSEDARSNYILTTDLGEEITIIHMKEEPPHGEEEISVPVSVLDENGSIISTKTIVTRYNSGRFQSSNSPGQPILINVTNVNNEPEIQLESI